MAKTPPPAPQDPANEEAAQAELESGTVEVVPDPDAGEFEPYVQWVGSSGVREITKEQWEADGIADQGTVIWTRELPTVPLSELTVPAQRRLQSEPDFTFVHDAPKEED